MPTIFVSFLLDFFYVNYCRMSDTETFMKKPEHAVEVRCREDISINIKNYGAQ